MESEMSDLTDYQRIVLKNAELRAKLDAAEGRIERASDFVKLRVHHSSMYYRALLTILLEPANAEEKSELHDWKRPRGRWHCVRCGAEKDGWARPVASGCPANAEGIASEGGSAEAANPRKEKADAPSAEAGDAKDPWSARVQASIDALTQPDQPDWQALAGELAEKGQVFLDADSSDAMQATAEDLQGALARYDEATAQHSGEER